MKKVILPVLIVISIVSCQKTNSPSKPSTREKILGSWTGVTSRGIAVYAVDSSQNSDITGDISHFNITFLADGIMKVDTNGAHMRNGTWILTTKDKLIIDEKGRDILKLDASSFIYEHDTVYHFTSDTLYFTSIVELKR